jgi:hypothetical protein
MRPNGILVMHDNALWVYEGYSSTSGHKVRPMSGGGPSSQATHVQRLDGLPICPTCGATLVLPLVNISPEHICPRCTE